MDIKGFIHYIKFQKRYSPLTVEAYVRDLNQFHDFFTQSGEAEITVTLLRSWVVYLMGENMDPVSIRRKLSALSSYFKYAIKRGLTNYNPAQQVIKPKKRKKFPSFVQGATMEAILNQDESAQTAYNADLMRVLVHLFYHLGIRRTELIGIKLADVDFANRQILIKGKGQKERILPLSSEIISEIERYLVCRNSVPNADKINHLLLTKKGQMLYPGIVHRLVRQGLEVHTNLSKNSPHVLRHSFATHLMDNGADINAVKALLGHSSLAATQVYTHTSIDKLKQAYKHAHPRSGKE
jgi:integrase/recombinase XerC